MDVIASAPWYVWVFFFIGVYATAIQLLKMLSAFGSEMAAPHTSASRSEPGSPEFVEALANAMGAPMYRGGTARMLNNGDEFYPALMDAIRSARHSVHIMTYIWKKGVLSTQVLDALIDCARRGVEVRIMMDGIGSFFAPRKKIKELHEAGGQSAVFSPLIFREIIHIERRNHRRAFVIDGRIAYTGGITIADQWLGHAQDPHHWRDTMIEVTGPMARSLQSAFVSLWMNVKGEVLSGPAYYPPDEDPLPNPHVLHVGVASAPSTEVQPLLHFLWFTLYSAHKRILIANAYFTPDRHIRRVLREKARAGIDVQIMVPSKHTDNQLVRWSSHYFYQKYLEAGVRIYEYQPTMMHAKHMVIDGQWTVVGSANVDIRSVMMNQENVIGISDPVLAAEVERIFFEDVKQCKEITLEEWRKRPWWWHVREQLAVLFKVQY